MNTNTVVLIVVAILAALVLAGVVVGVGYKLRADRRPHGDTSILDEVAEDARLAAELTTKAHTADVDSGIAAFRNRGRRTESADSRETADMRAQLKDHGSPAD